VDILSTLLRWQISGHISKDLPTGSTSDKAPDQRRPLDVAHILQKMYLQERTMSATLKTAFFGAMGLLLQLTGPGDRDFTPAWLAKECRHLLNNSKGNKGSQEVEGALRGLTAVLLLQQVMGVACVLVFMEWFSPIEAAFVCMLVVDRVYRQLLQATSEGSAPPAAQNTRLSPPCFQCCMLACLLDAHDSVCLLLTAAAWGRLHHRAGSVHMEHGASGHSSGKPQAEGPPDTIRLLPCCPWLPGVLCATLWCQADGRYTAHPGAADVPADGEHQQEHAAGS
jgi:hypothetical protein